jgi:hypothetical protein
MMAKEAEFDPLNVAAGLAVLESELRGELHGDSGEALRALKFELSTVRAQACLWAERHAIASECIPAGPEAESGVESWMDYLVRLASVLDCLGTLAALAHAPPDPEILAQTWSTLVALQGETLQLNDDLDQLETGGQMTEAAASAIRNRSRTILEILERLLSEVEQFRAAEPEQG